LHTPARYFRPGFRLSWLAQKPHAVLAAAVLEQQAPATVHQRADVPDLKALMC
jgi:hypothetical protein